MCYWFYCCIPDFLKWFSSLISTSHTTSLTFPFIVLRTRVNPLLNSYTISRIAPTIYPIYHYLPFDKVPITFAGPTDALTPHCPLISHHPQLSSCDSITEQKKRNLHGWPISYAMLAVDFEANLGAARQGRHGWPSCVSNAFRAKEKPRKYKSWSRRVESEAWKVVERLQRKAKN